MGAVVLSLLVFLTIALIVLGAMIAGFAGPPAHRSHPAVAWTLFAVGLLGLALSVALLFTGHGRLDALMAAGSACALALSARFLRDPDPGLGGDERRRHDDTPPGDPPTGDTPWDWQDFDRARTLWSSREGAGR